MNIDGTNSSMGIVLHGIASLALDNVSILTAGLPLEMSSNGSTLTADLLVLASTDGDFVPALEVHGTATVSNCDILSLNSSLYGAVYVSMSSGNLILDTCSIRTSGIGIYIDNGRTVKLNAIDFQHLGYVGTGANGTVIYGGTGAGTYYINSDTNDNTFCNEDNGGGDPKFTGIFSNGFMHGSSTFTQTGAAINACP